MIPHLPAGAPILRAAAMRVAEERAFAAGISQEALMERAGLAVALQAHRLAIGRRTIVVAGPGNNGGDAYVTARWLAEWGHDVTIAASGHAREGVAAVMASRWRGSTVRFDMVAVPDEEWLLVDGLFGTGVSRTFEMTAAQREVFERARYRVAIDQPSHLATDSGDALWQAPAANITVTFAALKPVHVLARGECGAVIVADIGVDDFVARDWRTIARPAVTAPRSDAHKYRSRVTVVAGAMPGAARLAARGAAGAGTGYVTLLGAAQPPRDAIVHRPADDLATVLDEGDGWIVVGPGLGRDDSARAVLDVALASRAALVLDGDALTLLGKDAAAHLRERAGETILTPHEGEFARMFGSAGEDKIARTIAAAEATGVTIVHKGAATIIATPDRQVRVSTEGSSWLATAGSGDVLAGAIAAQGVEGGVWLHAYASRMVAPAFSADALADALPLAVAAAR